MAKWEHFNALWSDFGVGCGRLLVEFPGDWRKQVITLADRTLGPVHAHSIKTKLSDQGLRLQKLTGPSGRASEGSAWQKKAVRQQDGDKPFRAIVVRTAHAGSDVLVAGEFERDVEPWKVNRQDGACPRNAKEMLSRVKLLLRHSEKVKLVDRNFDPSEPRFTRPFGAFIGVREKWKSLELHTATPKHFDPDAIRSKYRRKLELDVPKGSTLEVFLWPGLPDGDRMHPRFVLTERGGVYFDYGLDETEGSAETTLVALLEHEVYFKKWQDFSEFGTCFGKPERFQVDGKG
ncbi:MAG TPA: hypothetical protein VGO67_03280 [Verrucomicrobiae bacterium]